VKGGSRRSALENWVDHLPLWAKAARRILRLSPQTGPIGTWLLLAPLLVGPFLLQARQRLAGFYISILAHAASSPQRVLMPKRRGLHLKRDITDRDFLILPRWGPRHPPKGPNPFGSSQCQSKSRLHGCVQSP